MAPPKKATPKSLYGYASGYKPTPAPKPPTAQFGGGGRTNYGPTGAYGAPPSYGLAPPTAPAWGGDGGGGGGGGGGYAPPTGRWVTPDYSGILGAFTADARARFGAGLQAKKEARLSSARSLINRLGVRDVPGMLAKLSQYGLTEADLQGAAANPWSELKALQQQGQSQWANAVANRAARGGYRSGGTVGARQRIDQEQARQEGLLTQGALEGLSSGLQEESEWERTQREQLEQSIAQQQAALAAAYQPYWMQD